ncbi:MAG: phosphate/phosphite/phosphonate ABC transporter substrate-binding protein [Proteobacteria bacterium]|nr:phosphate/phosphite/phosphonate ABC transporter substrate-binding protein [Pseudomonadota bacterium]MBU1737906.1 phosphate/phosphite/phosphonate ABC transporter substrate-binding protein [Pseudomonadota bacterium]
MKRSASRFGRKFVVTLIVMGAIIFLFTPGQPLAGEKGYTIGLIPQGPALKMYERWAPFIDRLSKETGLLLSVKVYDHVSQFENSLKEGLVDFAYLNSTQEAAAFNQQGYIPLVRSEKFFKGAIFVPTDSKISSVQELKGQNIAFVSERSLCSVVLRQALSTEEEIGDFHIVYAGSSGNVYKNVLLGKAEAGGTLDVSLNRESSEVVSRLKTIYETPPMAPHPIAAHPRTPEAAREAIVGAMLRMAGEEEGKKLLESIRMPSPLVLADYQRDYRWLEKYMVD